MAAAAQAPAGFDPSVCVAQVLYSLSSLFIFFGNTTQCNMGLSDGVEVRESPIHGRGVFAKHDLPAGYVW
jgi:hypothetical protein